MSDTDRIMTRIPRGPTGPTGPNARTGVDAAILKNVMATQIATAMRVHNMDTFTLIQLSGLSRNTILNAVDGERLLTKASVLRICAALRISEQWLKTPNSGLDAEGAPRPMNAAEVLAHRDQLTREQLVRDNMALNHGEVPVDLQTMFVPHPDPTYIRGATTGRRPDTEEQKERKRLLAQRMRLILKARSLSQDCVPNLSAQAMWNICKGNSWPTFHTFVKIGIRLGLSVGQLQGMEPMTANDFIGGTRQMNERLATAIMDERRKELEDEMANPKGPNSQT